jgi:hypothetical protein
MSLRESDPFHPSAALERGITGAKEWQFLMTLVIKKQCFDLSKAVLLNNDQFILCCFGFIS